MKVIRIAGSIATVAAALAALSGCVATLGAPGRGVTIGVPPPVFSTVPAPGPAADDWWYDGSTYYFFDPGYHAYFYYGPSGEVLWCRRNWTPDTRWRRTGNPGFRPRYRADHHPDRR